MAQFRDREAIRERFNNNPAQFIALLEGAMTAGQIDALETALFPEPDDALRRQALLSARLVLVRAGIPAGASAVRNLDSEIAALPEEAAVPRTRG